MDNTKKTREHLIEEIEQLKIQVAGWENSEIELLKLQMNLEVSEQKSRIWLENSPVCTKILDLNFNLQYMSSSGVRELKIDDITQFYGKPYPLDFYPDSFKIPMKNNLKKVKEDGKIITQEAPIVDTEGNTLWYHSTIVPVYKDETQLDYIMVVSLETTERKLVEYKLKESEESFRKISENAPVLINSFDKDGRCLFWNMQCNKTFGWTIEEINAQEVSLALFYPDPAVCEEVIRTVTTDPDGSFREWHPVTKAGKILSIMWANFTLPNGQVFSMGHDITERKKLEKISQAAKEYAENIVATVRKPLLILDKDLRVVSAGHSFYKTFEVNPEETVGQLLYDLGNRQWDIPVLRNLLEEVLPEKKTVEDYEIEHNFEDIGKKTMLLNARKIIREEEEELILIAIEDITEQKKLEKISQEAKEYAQNIVATIREPLVILDKNLRVVSAGNSFYTTFEVKPEETVGKLIYDLGNHQWDIPVLRNLLEEVLPEKNTVEDFEIEHNFEAIGKRIMLLNARKILREEEEEEEELILLAIEDVTERKKLEKISQEAKEYAQNIVATIREPLVILDKNLRVVSAGHSFYTTFEVNPEETVGQLLYDLGNRQWNIPILRTLLEDVLPEKNTVEDYEIEHKFEDIGKKTMLLNARKIIREEEEEELILLAIEDITERKQAELALKESEEKLKNTFDLSPSIISKANIDTGYFIEANQAVTRILGYSIEEFTSTPIIEMIHPSDIQKTTDEIEEQLKGKEVTFFENRYLCKNGSYKWMAWHGTKADKHGMITAIGSDIAERKLAGDALKESEAKLNALFTSLTEIVVMHELVLNDDGEAIDYRIIDCNKVFTEVTGIRKEDAIGKLASEVYQTDPPPYLDKYAKVALGGDPHEFTTYYAPLDRHFMISVVSPQAGKFACISTDISEMMQIQEMVMAKNREMENYLYIASHDLRTPLVNIQGFSLRLKKQADSIKNLFADKTLEPEIVRQLGLITDENIPKTLSFVFSSVHKMDALINGLLQLSRTGRVEMNIQKIDMNGLFAKIVQNLDFQIKEAQCKIHLNPLPGCYGDAALLDQLFTNIISNALKYSHSERTLEIRVEAKTIYNRVVYTIRDTGIGMAEKYLGKIWDVFYRIAPHSGKSGDGIGLSLVKQIAEKHKGKVWAESEENRGSAFFIELHSHTFSEF